MRRISRTRGEGFATVKRKPDLHASRIEPDERGNACGVDALGLCKIERDVLAHDERAQIG